MEARNSLLPRLSNKAVGLFLLPCTAQANGLSLLPAEEFRSYTGRGVVGMLAGVTSAVIATAVAGVVFSWLRRRSGSLLAPIALHWSLNGLGALAAALVWHLSS